MLEGTYAFEKRWSELRERYPTTPAQDALIVHTINQLSSNHKAVNELAETLPEDLRILFRELAQAYLKAQRVSADLEQEAIACETFVIDKPSSLHSSSKNKSPNPIQNEPEPLPEFETLIVDKPTYLEAKAEPAAKASPSAKSAVEKPKPSNPATLKSSRSEKAPLEQQIQELAQKRKPLNLDASIKIQKETKPSPVKQDLPNIKPVVSNKEEMAQILTTDRPRVIVNSVKPNLFQRIINLLLGRD
ncbi:MAG TPA: hypothetical protein V6C78_35370 [Crinalium sp.]|jgi:hypothetical protein